MPVRSLMAAACALAMLSLPAAAAPDRAPGGGDAWMAGAAVAAPALSPAAERAAIAAAADREALSRSTRAGVDWAGTDPVRPSQQGSFSRYDDYCGDSGAAPDTWFSTVQESPERPGEVLFTTGFCTAFDPASWGPQGVTAFDLEMGLDGDGRDFVVAFHDSADSETGLVVVVLRTPDDAEPGTWEERHTAPALQPVPDEVGAYVPASAFDPWPGSSFLFAHRGVYEAGVDRLPEAEELGIAPAIFPNVCTGQRFGAAVEGPPEAVAAAAERLRGRGFGVDGGLARLGRLDVDAAVARVRAEVADLDVTVRAPVVYTASRTPDDPGFAEQWPLPAVRAPEAWDATTGSSEVLVAVLDQGVDGRDPEFAGRMVAGFDGVLGRPTGPANARGFHGTSVASVLGATGDNGRDLAGLDWGARIMPVAVFDANGCAVDSWIAAGVEAAVEAGADVITMSLGGPDASQVLAQALDAAADAGAILVAASGNGGPELPVAHPAAHPDVIAVGASTRDGSVAGYSQGGAQLDVVAPGGDDADPVPVLLDNFGAAGITGTSFAAPVVAGAAALYLAMNPGGTPASFRTALLATARDVAPAGVDPRSGHGLVDVAALLAQVQGGEQPYAQLTESTPQALSVAASQARFADAARVPAHAVLARDDVFADSLAGSPLGADGPLLFTSRSQLDQPVAVELRRAVPLGATVYLLGGTAALDAPVEQAVADLGYRPVRLAGPSRVHTAMAIADEVRQRTPGGVVAVARDDAWADSVTGGAWAAEAGVAVVVTGRFGLHPDLRGWLEARRPPEVVLLGGTAALSEGVQGEVAAASGGTVRRVAGGSRDDTAAAIDAELRVPTDAVYVIPGYDDRGWVPGLLAAGLAADRAAAVLIGNDVLSEATRARLAGRCDRTTAVSLVGQLSPAARAAIGAACS